MAQKSVLQNFTHNTGSDGLPKSWSPKEVANFCRLAIAVNAAGLDWWQTKTPGEFARFGSIGNGKLRAAVTLGIVKGKKPLSLKMNARLKNIPIIPQDALTKTLVVQLEKYLHTYRHELREQFDLDPKMSGCWPNQSLADSVNRIPYEELLSTGDLERTKKEIVIVEKILRDGQLNDTEKRTLILSRIGQGAFRKAVLKRAGGICEVTGVENETMLIASHILPWAADGISNKDRLDPNNGLILSPNLDKLFDRGFISFNDEGRILVKTEDDAKLLREMLPSTSADLVGLIKKPVPKQCKFLEEHRKLYKFSENAVFLPGLILSSRRK